MDAKDDPAPFVLIDSAKDQQRLEAKIDLLLTQLAPIKPAIDAIAARVDTIAATVKPA